MTDTIRSLKTRVLREIGAANSEVDLIFNLVPLDDDDQDVGGYGIVEGDSVSVVLRFPEVVLHRPRQPSPRRPFWLYVQPPRGPTFRKEVHPYDSVYVLKKNIWSGNCVVPMPDFMDLVSNGVILENRREVDSYGLREGDHVYVRSNGRLHQHD